MCVCACVYRNDKEQMQLTAKSFCVVYNTKDTFFPALLCATSIDARL